MDEKKENWMNVCKKTSTSFHETMYVYETQDRDEIRDYFGADVVTLEWIDSQDEDTGLLLTILVYPHIEAVQYALGTYDPLGVGHPEVSEGIDNREFCDDDYNSVLDWLAERLRWKVL